MKSVLHFLLISRARCAYVSAFLILLALLVSACTGPGKILNVTTNIPEFATLAEQYEAQSGKALIRLNYVADLASTLQGGKVPDILIGTGLDTVPALNEMTSQKSLVDDLDHTQFYPFTFQKLKDDYRLTILSFDLPAIVTNVPETSQDFSESVVIPLENLGEKGAQFTTRKKGSLSSLGFSPLYSNDFVYLLLQYSGAALSGDSRGFPSWDDDGLKSGISLLSSWSTRYAGSPDAEHAFLSKYAYDPPFRLLSQNRFAYAYVSASTFLKQGADIGPGLSLHWPTWKGSLQIRDDFVGAAIPLQSSHKADALDLIHWMLDAEVQRHYITETIAQGAGVFGFLNGFSTLREVNETTIPILFPRARLRIPPESILQMPAVQGIKWDSFKKDILGPWIHSEVSSAKPSTDTLKERSRRWLLGLGLNP